MSDWLMYMRFNNFEVDEDNIAFFNERVYVSDSENKWRRPQIMIRLYGGHGDLVVDEYYNIDSHVSVDYGNNLELLDKKLDRLLPNIVNIDSVISLLFDCLDLPESKLNFLLN